MVLASPFIVAFYLHYQTQWIGPQAVTPAARFSSPELTKFREAALTARHAPRAEPIILAYHDIAWHSISRYVVTPARFEAQMAMLHAAGYHTLTAKQLVTYLHGGSVPSLSVAITFDDGTRGLWTYADKILARYHFHGISFVITGRVGTRRPYYLTWQEIRRMYASGRWDFESHTDSLHQLVRVSASGALGDPLTRLIWLPGKHRMETLAEFEARIRADLRDSISDMAENGLPRPQLFAYPFSDSLGARPYSAAAWSTRFVNKIFAIAMTNYLDPAVPFSRREAASGGQVSRLEVFSSDTAASLFSQMRVIASLPVGDMRALRSRTRWESENGNPANIALVRKSIRFTGRKTWDYAAFAPGSTADWDGYTVTAMISGLNYQANPSATLSVRVGSRSQLNVSVSNHYLEVRLGAASAYSTALATALGASLVHQVTVQVRPRLTVVSVDGKVAMKKHATPGPLSTGGIALSSFRPGPQSPFPFFRDITLKRIR
jgi:biofilm PGA synthesis lipoprotein PgaB